MGASPAHTHGTRLILPHLYVSYEPTYLIADMLALRQDLHELLGLLRQTGVGSLPLNDNPSAEAIERDTELTYERLTRSHGSAGTVLHLLTSSGSSSIGK